MQQWLDILREVRDSGDPRMDRTGVGTRAVFGRQLVFDNATTFPAVTCKRLAFGQVAAELAAFIGGAETLAEFHAHGCTIWDGNANAPEWLKRARCEGDVGRIYGSLWRRWSKPKVRPQPEPRLRNGLLAPFLGVANGHGSSVHPLGKTWQGMITRCYDPKAVNYHLYGGRGVFVDNAWLEFEAFVRDAVKLPGWDDKAGNMESFAYQLDKDTVGDGFRYGPNHCAWLSPEDNHPKKDSTLYTVEGPAGDVFTFTNPSKFCAEHGLQGKNFCDLWTGRKNAKTREGFRLLDVQKTDDQEVDQLRDLVDGLIKTPYSRRHVVTALNPGEIELGALPPCHVLFQCFVTSSGQLHLRVDMRSVDLFLGLPFDIASYALLQRLIAREVGLSSGRLVFQLGDAHVYDNHWDQVETVLGRKPLHAPHLLLCPGSLFSFKADQASLIDYSSWDAVRAPLNV